MGDVDITLDFELHDNNKGERSSEQQDARVGPYMRP